MIAVYFQDLYKILEGFNFQNHNHAKLQMLWMKVAIFTQCTMAQALNKFGIKDFAKIMTLAPIFSSQNYFR